MTPSTRCVSGAASSRAAAQHSGHPFPRTREGNGNGVGGHEERAQQNPPESHCVKRSGMGQREYKKCASAEPPNMTGESGN
jgi:hypothetical protein